MSPKKVPIFVYVHPDDLERGRERFPDLFSGELHTVRTDRSCVRGKVFCSSLPLEDDDGTWGDYGCLNLDDDLGSQSDPLSLED